MANKYETGAKIFEGLSAYQQGQSTKISNSYEAMQQYQNAKRRRLAGQREASMYRREGRVAVSDATVSMIGQGGTVDSEMLAKLKSQADINAIGALYDSKVDALQTESQARMNKIMGKAAYRQGVLKLGSSLIGAAAPWIGAPPGKNYLTNTEGSS